MPAPPRGRESQHPFPRLRWAALIWLSLWVPAYASVWGASNFLHLCDVAVILTCAGLWSGGALLLSSQAVSSLLIDLLWDVDAGARLFTGRHLVGGRSLRRRFRVLGFRFPGSDHGPAET